MRPGKGCESCRERHLKCVITDRQSACTRCAEVGRDCNFSPKFKFRHVSHVDTASQGVRSRTILEYEDDQTWVSTGNPVGFVLEDGSGLEYDATNSYASHIANVDDDEAFGASDGIDNHPAVEESLSNPIHDIVSVEESNTAREDHGWLANNTPKPDGRITSSRFEADVSSPASIFDLTRRYEDGSPNLSRVFASGTPLPAGNSAALSPATSLLTPGGIPSLKLSRREAFLVHHFVHKIAPWIDACDLSSHFALEVPKRAVQRPMVLYSVLALSSRQHSISTGQPDHEASFYHAKCLGVVIEALSAPEATYDDNLLSTFSLLRIFEELDQSTDEYLHIQGMSRLLTAIPTFAHSGGLAEAACWQCLRQDIFVALMNCQPPSFHLENYDHSSAFKFRDDAGAANVIILLFAKALRLIFSAEADRSEDNFALLESDVERWNDRRAALFQSIYYEDLDVHDGRPFPIIYMINAPQVIAMQYYYATKIYLKLHKPMQQLSGFHAAKQRRVTEGLVTHYLATIIGLALSNEKVENANFTGHHLLRTCGYCINNPLQREHALHFLERTHKIMGWNTSHTVTLLEAQWTDLDNPND